MSEHQHTPGPWEYESDDPHRLGHIIAPDGTLVGEVHGDWDDNGSETEANARLIAAAPDMDLLLAGITAGVIRPEPATGELAFGGLRYSIGREVNWSTIAGIMGRKAIAAAIATKEGA